MIIKSLSRSSKSGSGAIGQLVEYILKEKKYTKTNHKSRFEQYLSHLSQTEHCYIAGLRFSKQDIKHLMSEATDAKLLAEMKAFPGTVEEFIKTCLVNKSLVQIPKEEKATLLLKHNIASMTAKGMAKEFEKNEANRMHKRVDQTLINHMIFSWHNQDGKHLTDAMLTDMARKYIELRGENNLYCFTKHVDKEHTHLHAAVSGTSLNGLSSRISKDVFAYIKVEMDRYQKEQYPELCSLPEHGKSKNRGKGAKYEYKIDERANVKSTLLKCTDVAQRSATSTEHFLSLLQEQGFSAYYRAGVLTGVQSDNGLKFRFSRLGVDMAALQERDDKKAKDDKAVNELRELRAGRGKLQMVEIEKEETAIEKQEIQPNDTIKNENSEPDSSLPSADGDTESIETEKENDNLEKNEVAEMSAIRSDSQDELER